MRDAQKPDHVSLNTLIGRLREGRFVSPDFRVHSADVQEGFSGKPGSQFDRRRRLFFR